MDRGKESLRKELSLLNLVIIGISGAVGTGALFSSAGMASNAGPALVISWILGGIFYFFIGLTYVELSINFPEAGGPARYPLYSHGKVTNVINAFSSLIWYLFVPPIEALAVVYGLNFFTNNLLINSQGIPTTLGGIIGVIIMLLFVPFNYYSVKFFGKSTTVIGIIKLILYLAVGLGFILLFTHLQNLTAYGGFAPFGFLGIFSAIPLAMFAFGGIRVLPDYAEETKDYKTLDKAIIYTVIGQTLFYILFSLAFVLSIDWNKISITPGNWADLSNIPGNPFISIASTYNVSSLLILTVIIGIIGPFVTGYIYVGGGMRVLFAMARSKLITEKMKELNEYSVPFWALIVFVVIGALVSYLSAPIPTIYGLIEDSVVAGYIAFAASPVSLTSLKREGKIKEIIPGTDIISPLAFIFASLIIFWSGWPSVPYSVLLLTVASVIFSVIYKIKENIVNSLWYIGYIAFLLFMTYIGGVGALSIINFYFSSLIVAIISLIFYFLGVESRIRER
ncbi:APC family permease [Sulfurisphaera javensis]|uniref:APC family permease n=1 Tax=Sulfurisphaera javensis TaxID=2049879 RepID=A0AAT9GTA7_9CREN